MITHVCVIFSYILYYEDDVCERVLEKKVTFLLAIQLTYKLYGNFFSGSFNLHYIMSYRNNLPRNYITCTSLQHPINFYFLPLLLAFRTFPINFSFMIYDVCRVGNPDVPNIYLKKN